MVKEIKNKQLAKELSKRGLNKVTLCKDTSYGYFYFMDDESGCSGSFCIYSFKECTPCEWANMIETEINNNK